MTHRELVLFESASKTMIAIAASFSRAKEYADRGLFCHYFQAGRYRAGFLDKVRMVVHPAAAGINTVIGAPQWIEDEHETDPVIPICTEDYLTPARRPAWSVLADRKFELEQLNSMRPWEDALDDCLLRYREELFRG